MSDENCKWRFSFFENSDHNLIIRRVLYQLWKVVGDTAEALAEEDPEMHEDLILEAAIQDVLERMEIVRGPDMVSDFDEQQYRQYYYDILIRLVNMPHEEILEALNLDENDIGGIA